MGKKIIVSSVGLGKALILAKLIVPEPGEPVGEEKYEELLRLLEAERERWR